MENKELIQSALMDAYDIMDALSDEVKSQPKDDEGTDITIGDCLHDIILTLENLLTETEGI